MPFPFRYKVGGEYFGDFESLNMKEFGGNIRLPVTFLDASSDVWPEHQGDRKLFKH